MVYTPLDKLDDATEESFLVEACETAAYQAKTVPRPCLCECVGTVNKDYGKRSNGRLFDWCH